MPRIRLPFAIPTHLVAGLGLCAVTVSGALAAGAPSAPVTGAAVWRLAMGHAETAPVDPTFVGPPVPLAILFAPAATANSRAASGVPFGAGMRIEREPVSAPFGPAVLAPPAEPTTRWADVFSRLTPVRHPDGSLSLDLTGITIVDARAWRDAHGVHWSDGDAVSPGETDR
jgi:hypothetical protein